MAELEAAADRLGDGVKKVLHALVVDFAKRMELKVDGNVIVGYWVGNMVRIDIKDPK